MAIRRWGRSVSRWTLASLLTVGLTAVWLVANTRAREAAASGVRRIYSERTPGIVEKRDVSSTISITRVYVGRSQTPRYDTSSRSEMIQLTVSYKVDGKTYEVTGEPRNRDPQVGDEVTVYYHPRYPANAHLQERLDDWIDGAADRYASPLTIAFLGFVTSAGLWFHGHQKASRLTATSQN